MYLRKWFPLLGFNLFFIFSRIGYFLIYPIPKITRDIFSYYEPAINIINNQLPLFNIRTPGYPIFLYISQVFVDKLQFVVLLQCIVTALVFNVILISIFNSGKIKPNNKFLLLLTVILVISLPEYIDYNTAIIPISLFTDFIIASFTFFCFYFLLEKRNEYLFISLFFLLLSILLRPQGLFLTPIILILFFDLTRYKQFKRLFYSLSILLIPIIGIIIYNKATINTVSYTGKFSTLVSVGSSIFCLEPNEKYSSEVNEGINDINSRINLENKKKFAESWDIIDLSKRTSLKDYDLKYQFSHLLSTHENELKQLAFDAKKKHPYIYLKFVLAGIIKSFRTVVQPYHFYYNEIVNRKIFFKKEEAIRNGVLINRRAKATLKEFTEYYNDKKDNDFALTPYETITWEEGMSNESFLVKVLFYYHVVLNKILNTPFLLVLFFSSTFLVFKNKLLLFTNLTILANHGLISLSIIPMPAYLFPTKVLIIFTVAVTIKYLGEKLHRLYVTRYA